MKTLKLAMFALSILLIVTGCKNPVMPKAKDSDFAKNVQEDSAETPYVFKVSNVVITRYGTSNDYRVKVTFDKQVGTDKDALTKGVKFYKLSNASTTTAMPKTESVTSKCVSIVDKEANFEVKDLQNVEYLYMYITADEVKALNGSKLNRDGDRKYGEKYDDDYAQVWKKDSSNAYQDDNGSALTGNIKFNLNIGFTGDSIEKFPLPVATDYSYAPGTNGESGVYKTITIKDTQFNALFAADEKDSKYSEITNLINKYFKYEQYDWEKKVWEEVKLDFKLNDTKDGWVSKIEVKPYRALRCRWVNLDKWEIKSKLYAYTLKQLIKNNDGVISADVSQPHNTVSLSEDYPMQVSNLSLTKPENGKAVITFTFPAAGLTNALYEKNAWQTVKAENVDATKDCLFAGFDTDTLIKANFKFVDTNKKELAIKEIYYESSDFPNYPHAQNKVTFIFEDEAADPSKVYISPKVKTKAFDGHYVDVNDNTTRVKYTIPSMNFRNINASGDPNTLGGWSKLNLN